jgi:hypothetical protein
MMMETAISSEQNLLHAVRLDLYLYSTKDAKASPSPVLVAAE